MAEQELQRRMARHLKDHRATLGLTQERFGELVDRSGKYIGHIEQGRRNLTFNAVQYLADRLLLDPGYFYGPVPVDAPPPRGRWRTPDLSRRPGRTSARTPGGWTVAFPADSSDAFTATLAALAAQGFPVTFRCRDDAVHDCLPVAAADGQVRCLRWDADGDVLSDEQFILEVTEIASIDVW